MNDLQPDMTREAHFMCPSCDANDIIKYGKDRSGKQVFKCKPCGTKFTEGGALPRRRIPPNVVGDAIVGLYDGLSHQDTQRQIETRYGFKPSTATLYEWVRDYVKGGKQFLSTFKANTGDLWVADEMTVEIRRDDRLITSRQKRTKRSRSFTPSANRGARGRRGNRGG